jgi:hypothetical protein
LTNLILKSTLKREKKLKKPYPTSRRGCSGSGLEGTQMAKQLSVETNQTSFKTPTSSAKSRLFESKAASTPANPHIAVVPSSTKKDSYETQTADFEYRPTSPGSPPSSPLVSPLSKSTASQEGNRAAQQVKPSPPKAPSTIPLTEPQRQVSTVSSSSRHQNENSNARNNTRHPSHNESGYGMRDRDNSEGVEWAGPLQKIMKHWYPFKLRVPYPRKSSLNADEQKEFIEFDERYKLRTTCAQREVKIFKKYLVNI